MSQKVSSSSVAADPITRLKQRFDSVGVNKRSLTPAEVKKIFRLADAYVASRVFAVLAGPGRRTVGRDELWGRTLSVAMGDQETKLRFLFDLHDNEQAGQLSPTDVKKMLDAALRQNEIQLVPAEKVQVVEALFAKANAKKDGHLDFTEFKRLIKGQPDILAGMLAGLGEWFGQPLAEGPTHFHGRRRFWGTLAFLFTTVPAAVYRFALVAGYIFLNGWLAWTAFQTYASAGANLWIQIARTSGAILNLNGALILLPMMRGLLGWIRRVPIFSRLVPVDDHIEIHKVFGNVLFWFGLVHTAAHLMNYLTLPARLEDSLFHTLAGLTGVIVLGLLVLMWFFARNFIRRSGRFELFWLSHALYGLWFAGMLIHAPHFWLWAGLPLVAYLVEWLIQRTQKRALSFVSKAKSLPGGVTELQLHRPQGFTYQPGDFLYLKIPAISRFEWHPFTISSHPEEPTFLSLHIRSAGNWTKALAKLFSETLKGEAKQLPAAIGGPYGTPSNRIFKAKHAILVGAGIGVTPFASILRSLLARIKAGEAMKVEKVHFIWLNRGQKSFDWFGDLLSEIEEQGPKGFFDIHIYLTNAKISAPSGLARIGMDLIHKETKRDLTTGLKSRTHFGRPDWDKLFEGFRSQRGAGASSVFFCGPAALAAEVRGASRYYGFRFRKENF